MYLHRLNFQVIGAGSHLERRTGGKCVWYSRAPDPDISVGFSRPRPSVSQMDVPPCTGISSSPLARRLRTRWHSSFRSRYYPLTFISFRSHALFVKVRWLSQNGDDTTQEFSTLDTIFCHNQQQSPYVTAIAPSTRYICTLRHEKVVLVYFKIIVKIINCTGIYISFKTYCALIFPWKILWLE